MTIVKKINDKDSKFKIGNIVRISKCKIIFGKVYVPNWSEEVFVILWLVILKAKKLLYFLRKKIAKEKSKKV